MALAKEPALDWPRDCRTGQACPTCGAEIVYSGNYFCSEAEFAGAYGFGRAGTCGWGMPESEEGPLFKRCLRGLMKNRQKP